MIFKTLKIGFLSLALITVLGCSSDSSEEAPEKNVTPSITGQLIDGPVSGVDYICSSGRKGITNLKGEFTCSQHDKIVFSFAGYTFAEIKAELLITPHMLFVENEDAALNFAQLLQTLDRDQNASNGIDIDTTLLLSLEDAVINFTSDSFDEDMALLLGSEHPLVNESDAAEHLDETFAAFDINPDGTTADDEIQSTDTIAPLFTTALSFEVYENQTIVSNILTDDINAFLSLFGQDADAFTLSNGALSFVSAPDFETKDSYTLSIRAEDRVGNNSSIDIVVSILDRDEIAPIFTGGQSFNINENVAFIAQISTDDETAVLSLRESPGFHIIGDSVYFNEAADFESGNLEYSFTLVATDPSGNSSEKEFNITLLNTIDVLAQMNQTSIDVEFLENILSGTAVGQVSIADIGEGSLSSMSLSGEGHEDFSIDIDGNIVLAQGHDLNSKIQTVYDLEAHAITEAGQSLGVSVVVNVKPFLLIPLYKAGYGAELFVSDTQSEHVVKDINDNYKTSGVRRTILMGDNLFFKADDGLHGYELWKSDGTPEGTVMVKDIYVGAGESKPDDFVVMNNKLYFIAIDIEHGEELWVSDGSTEGTLMVKDIYEGSTSSYINDMVAMNDMLYFQAYDSDYNYELWKSDGTLEGTMLLKDIYPGTNGSRPQRMIDVNGTLFFIADNGVTSGPSLWKSDGSESGTVLLKDLEKAYYLTDINGTLYFAGDNGVDGRELWISDGSVGGTTMLMDINPSGASNPEAFYVFNEKVYFFADDGTHGSELWVSDGTAVGTLLFKDINTGPSNAQPNNFVTLNNTLYFKAQTNEFGYELWKSDGTSEGTVMLKDIYTGDWGSYAQYMTVMNEHIYFYARDAEHGQEFWKSDGTAAGTVLVKDIYEGVTGSNPSKLLQMGDTLYFSADYSESNDELWKSDGTTEGTQLVKQINVTTDTSEIENVTKINDVYYFSATDGVHGEELWKSDGTPENTVMIKDIWEGASHSNPRNFLKVGDYIYFSASDGIHGVELWKSDGTQEGTVLVKDINVDNSALPSLMTVLDEVLYFRADDGVHGRELWMSDGTEANTSMVLDIYTGITHSLDSVMLEVNGSLYFIASSEAQENEIWMSDGSAEGTHLLKDLSSVHPHVVDMLEMNDHLYFLADDNDSMKHLWVSDGTEGGTQSLVHFEQPDNSDVNAEPLYGENMDELIAHNGALFFTTYQYESGYRLYKNDGISNSVEELAFFAGMEGIRFMISAENNLYFWKNDTDIKKLYVVSEDENGVSSVNEVPYSVDADVAETEFAGYETSSGKYVYFYLGFKSTFDYKLMARTDGESIEFISDPVLYDFDD